MAPSAGKLFSFELLDAQGGEIRGCGFNQCVDKFEPLMQQGAVIMLSKANLKNKRPNSVSQPLYSMSLMSGQKEHHPAMQVGQQPIVFLSGCVG